MSRARVRSRALAGTGLAGLAAVAVLLAGCGDDDPYASYCEQVETQQTAISEATASGGPGGLLAALPSFQALADAAPDDIAGDWAIVNGALGGLQAALDDAGITPEEYGSYDPADPPDGVSDDQARAIRSAATAVRSSGTAEALDAVQQQARDVCKTPLTR